MKKFTLILVLVILLSLVVVIPVFAGGGENPGKACENITGSGWFWGWRQAYNQYLKHGENKGRFYGPGMAYNKLCR